MNIQELTSAGFEQYIRYSNQTFQVLRALDQTAIYVAGGSTIHAAIATEFGIVRKSIASASQIDWSEPDLLTYSTAGSSLKPEYVQNDEQDKITADLIGEIIKAAGIVQVRFRFIG